MESIIKQECDRRLRKQQILDNMLYTESVSYAHWKFSPEILNEIDKLLKDAISDANDCEWVYYHHLNIQDLMSYIIPQAHAGYKEYSKETIIVYNSIVHLWLDMDLALHIGEECEGSWDWQHCYKFTVWVMKAESTLCRNSWIKNNCFWIMHRPNGKRRVKPYGSHKESISDFVRRYKKYRQWRYQTKHRVLPLWNYCTDHCQHREGNVQYAINIMNQPLSTKE